jgi:alkanesulfonate monooxygenase SsuD/methylene tetrahydromethanopterin reductase-like flavin-dependent oxidoreductase (luciferase family)
MWRSWDEILDLHKRAERGGFDAALVTDHFLSDWDGEGGDVLEAWTMLAALAREVPRIMIGTFVTSVTHRYPAVLAKQAVTVDHLSGGRLLLGLGAGWNQREHEAFGMSFPPPRERVDLVGETLAMLRLLETEDRPSYTGRHVSLVDTPFHPRPLGGHIPILIGSQGRRMTSHVARYADYWDLADSTEDEIREHTARLEVECGRIGRDPGEIVLMHEMRAEPGDPGGDLLARVERLAPLGISFFLMNIWPRSPAHLVDEIAPALEGLRSRAG